MRPRLALTMGDINGVGPEILAKALAVTELRDQASLLIIGDPDSYQESRAFAPDAAAICRVQSVAEIDWEDRCRIPILDGGLEIPRRRPGQLDRDAGRCAVEWVKLAARLAIEKSLDAIVTGPLNKAAMHLAGYTYAGHTELLAEATGTRDYRMGLFSGDMRVVHNSTHCSLSQAIRLTTTDRIVRTVEIADSALKRLGLAESRIAVCGLNPHAGEEGAFGNEEIERITPAVERARRSGVRCFGPFAADTIFNRMRAGEFDMVVAMYHDQGHAPMKLMAMDEAVNVTLGIPIIRTSVDHGTAFDIAGTGQARAFSLLAAIEMAVRLARGK